MTFDFKKEFKEFYLPPAQILERIKYIQSGNLAALKEMR